MQKLVIQNFSIIDLIFSLSFFLAHFLSAHVAEVTISFTVFLYLSHAYVPIGMVQMLASRYMNQTMQAKWDTCLADRCIVSSATKWESG